jgi:hypothetical protein
MPAARRFSACSLVRALTTASHSTNWALCVDRSRPLESKQGAPADSDYLASMQKEMVDATEHVVALVYYLPAEFAFQRDAARVPCGKAQIVACRTAYRGGSAGANIMKGLFKMVHDRAILDGAPIMLTSGIPSYCKDLYFSPANLSSHFQTASMATNMRLAWDPRSSHMYPHSRLPR